MAMSHPDIFAGAIPIAGIGKHYCKWYWNNARRLPFYIVNGELDRDSLFQNAHSGQVNKMLRRGFDIIYAEYVGWGYGDYYSEIHRLFEWMALHRRTKHLKEIEMKILRPSENRFYWVDARGFPQKVMNAQVLTGDRSTGISPMLLKAKITPGNSILITRSVARKYTLWLSPELIDFDRRVVVKLRSRRKFNDFLTPQTEAILEDLRVRGDRQKPYWAKIELD